MLSLRQRLYWVSGAILLIISIPLVVYAADSTLKADTSDIEIVALPETKVEVEKTEKEKITPDKQAVIDLINKYSSEFGIDATIPLRIANCESGYNTLAKNKNSTASGVFQFVRATWNGTPEGKQGLSPFDAEANIRAAIRKISEGGIGAWDASRSCWR